MEFHFNSRVTIKSSDDPLLKSVLEDCEIDVGVKVYCNGHWDDIDFMTLDVEDVLYNPPDSFGAVKAITLMHPELMDAIHIAAEDAVESRWGDYYHEAAVELQSIHDAAMEARYEDYREWGR